MAGNRYQDFFVPGKKWLNLVGDDGLSRDGFKKFFDSEVYKAAFPHAYLSKDEIRNRIDTIHPVLVIDHCFPDLEIVKKIVSGELVLNADVYSPAKQPKLRRLAKRCIESWHYGDEMPTENEVKLLFGLRN